MAIFKRKQKLRKAMQEDLLEILKSCRESWVHEKKVIENSIEPSGEVLQQLKLSEAKYLFLLKEARHQNLSIRSKAYK